MLKDFLRRPWTRTALFAIAIGGTVGLVRVGRMQGSATGGEPQVGCGGPGAPTPQAQSQSALRDSTKKAGRTRRAGAALHNPRALMRIWHQTSRSTTSTAPQQEVRP